MNVLDLFSGIGGFSLGLERAGMKTIAFCEIEPFCQSLLRKHWPGVPIFKDVRTLNATDITETVDLMCGGYPCQPFSTAGRRGGEKDDRHLWPEYLRLIQEIHPRWILAENVAGHISMGLDQVLSDLEDEDYKVWTFVIPAVALDAPHRRDRLWIIANANSTRSDRDQEYKVRARRDTVESCIDSLADTKSVPEDITSDTVSGRRGERRTGRALWLGEWDKGVSWQESSCGSPAWPVEPGVGRVANGIPNRVDRLKGLGNAVIPGIPEVIGRAIMAVENVVRH